jgi:small subunit ribosomal protein S6
MRHYETLYIVNPELDDENYKAVVDKFRDLIEKEKGVIVKLEEWGKQRLAYLVKKFDQGAYVLVDYCGGPGVTAELERDLKLDDRILKYQTVKLADDVDPQALVEKEKEEQTKKETAVKEEQVQEGTETAKDEKKESDASDEEVNNGIS